MGFGAADDESAGGEDGVGGDWVDGADEFGVGGAGMICFFITTSYSTPDQIFVLPL